MRSPGRSPGSLPVRPSYRSGRPCTTRFDHTSHWENESPPSAWSPSAERGCGSDAMNESTHVCSSGPSGAPCADN